jgi:carboxyl-terminal processing protease
VLALRNGSALKLTTARYFTPSGRVIENQGIEPDLILPPAPDSDPAHPSPDTEPGIEAALRTIRGMRTDG